jgi:uncharacterized protein
MGTKLSKKLRKLEEFLIHGPVNDDAMMLSELDGFLAGIVTCPGMIMPSEWLPVVWGEEAPEFESEQQAQHAMDLIMGHYNDIIRQLERNRYNPIYDIERDDAILWEMWIEGFWKAVRLRPQDWIAHSSTDDAELQKDVFILTRLYELASTPSSKIEPKDIDKELRDMAPDLIPTAVEALHHARLAQFSPHPKAANSNTPKTGRNDPCPCGSGKKFKKCCLN